LSSAPFVKVSATNFTESGIVGADVSSIIADLVTASMKMIQKRHEDLQLHAARSNAIVSCLCCHFQLIC